MSGLPRTLPEVIKRALESALADCHVAVPGKVLKYDATTNLADVDVQVQHSVWDDDNGRAYEDAGTLPGVPVMWPRASGFSLTMPIAAGDTGLLIFNSDAIGEWRSTGQKSQPADSSRLSVSWPVFVPGLYADANQFAAGDATARAAGILLGKDGAEQQLRIDATGVKQGASAIEHVMTAEATALMIYNVLVAFCSLFAALPGPPPTLNAGTWSAAAQPILAAAITAALAAQAAPAPAGLAAQISGAAALQAGFASGTAPSPAMLAAWTTAINALATKVLDVSGLYPSIGSSMSKTE